MSSLEVYEHRPSTQDIHIGLACILKHQLASNTALNHFSHWLFPVTFISTEHLCHPTRFYTSGLLLITPESSQADATKERL